MPSTTTDRSASCRARSLPLSSMAASTPSPGPFPHRGARASCYVDRQHSDRSHGPGHLQAAGQAVDRGHLGAAERASRVASSPMTPCPKTATRSPSRTSAAKTAFKAMDPTLANVPGQGPRRSSARADTAAAGTTASLR